MDDGGRCDAEDCTRRATQVATVPLPIRSLDLRLCEEHVAALRAGKLQRMSQDRRPHDGSHTRPRVSFAD